MLKKNGYRRGLAGSGLLKISALAILAGSSMAMGQGNYLLLVADNAATTEAVRTSVLNTGLITNLSIYPYGTSLPTPTLAELMQYDAVITWTNLSYADGAAMGDVLADYVDAGGGVVCAVYAVSTTTANRSLTGRWQTGGYDIIPQRSGNLTAATSLGTVHLPSHPLWDGLTGFSGSTNYVRASTLDAAPHALRVADWATGGVLAATSVLYPNRVDLNMYPTAWHVTPDGARLIANALIVAGVGGSTDPGGCCFDDGSCQVLAPLDCITQGGNFRGGGTDCVAPCPQPGACCFPDGSCDFMLEANCVGTGGTFAGAAVTCAAANCPQPATGACCLSDGSCVIVWEPGCLAQGGLYQGDNTNCAAVICPLSLTTSYDGTSNATAANAGVFFDVTALNQAGIVVEGFQMNSPAAAGTPMTVQVWVKPGTYVGSEGNQAAWTMLGQVETIAAGLGERTPVPVGDLHIAPNETWGVRMTTLNGGHRYNTAATTLPLHSNSDLQIQLGAVQNNNWGSVLSGTLGWNGTVFYSVGANVELGACCFPDGTCGDFSEAVCTATGGVYQGANTDCATTACPQPGACCLPAACIIVSEGQCAAIQGDYRGNGTDCATANCPITAGSLIGFTFTTAASTTLDPQNWTRISTPTGSLFNVPDELGNPTAVGIDWSGGVGGNGFLFLGTATLAPNAVPQHSYDLSGMSGYGYRASGEFTIQLSGLTPNTDYEYWFVAYRSTSAISQLVQVSQGDTLNAIPVVQNVTAGENNGRFIVNETLADDSMLWDALSFITTSSSAGTVTFNWAGTGQTPVIGALAIREVFGETCYANCDGSTTEPILNVDDFTCFINEFAQALNLPHEQQVTHYANCDGSTTAPVLNVDDFTCFINAFAAGCP